METLLFNLADFAPYCELPELDTGRLEPHMLRAQRRLRPLLGDKLYTELMRRKKADDLAEPWAALREQAVPALVYGALAQYWPFSQTTMTRNGLRQKEVRESSAIDARTLAAQATIYQNEAISYEVELRTWLIANATNYSGFYPAGQCGPPPPARTPSVVVQAIGVPESYCCGSIR